jgi:nitronate monooxygenase
MMWRNTRVSELLGIRYPILQGPLGGGYSTAALTAAVSNAGALGSFGAVSLTPQEIRRTVRDVATRTDRPFALNLWVPIAGPDNRPVSPEDLERSARHLRPYFAALGIPAPPLPAPTSQRFEEQVQALLEARPPVFSFVMGIPDAAILREASQRGIRTIGAATTVEEGEALAAAGVDVIIASGTDAGGHRSSFLRPVESSQVGTLSLVPQLTSAVRTPVVAAGGIADGRGVAAALALGAEGVQVGTAFLATPESGAPPVHRELLGTPRSRTTRLTRAFSGRHGRSIENELMLELEKHPEDVLSYPAQNALTAPLRRAAAEAGKPSMLALWAGQSAGLARHVPAAQLVETLARETGEVLQRLASLG